MEGPEVVNQQQAYSTPQYGGPPPQWGYQPPVVTQPQMSNTNNTTVVINQQSTGPAYKPPRAWSTGICGCFDDLGVCECDVTGVLVALVTCLEFSFPLTISAAALSSWPVYVSFINICI